MDYLSDDFLLKIITEIISTSGNIQPASTPFCKLSPKLCDTEPTMPGPKVPPKSPAMARSANIAVPPLGNLCDEMLMVPGHMIPTEAPQRIQPTRLIIGFGASEAKR